MVDSGITWLDLLKDVGQNIEDAEKTSLIKMLEKDNGRTAPSTLEGLPQDELKTMKEYATLSYPQRGALGRCWAAISTTPEVPPTQVVSKTVVLPTQTDTARAPFMSLMGNETGESTEAISAAVGYTDEVNIEELLAENGYDDLSPDLIADKAVWTFFMSEKRQHSKCHTYVDLTTKSMLPVHVSMDAIGGRVGVPGEGEDGGVPTAGATGHIEMFNRALKAVSEKPKFFRNMQQWHAAYSKYAIVAVCTKQMTQAQVSNHRDNICQLCEICRVEGWSPLTPVLYDDMVRKEWHRRASRRDESFKFGEECKVTVDRIWAATKQRILTVLNACGVPTKDRPST